MEIFAEKTSFRNLGPPPPNPAPGLRHWNSAPFLYLHHRYCQSKDIMNIHLAPLSITPGPSTQNLINAISSKTLTQLVHRPTHALTGMLILVLVLKDSLRTFLKSLSLSWSLGVRSLSLSLSLGGQV